MPKKTKKTIVATIVEKTGVKPGKAKQALETVALPVWRHRIQ
jgi:hypothetical protein